MAANLACIRNISSRFASCWKSIKINQCIRQVHGTEVSLAGSLRGKTYDPSRRLITMQCIQISTIFFATID